MLDLLTIKLNVKTVDNTLIFNLFSTMKINRITLVRYGCYNIIKLTIYLQFSIMKIKRL